MSTRWMPDEIVDAVEEREKQQPYHVIANLLNSKYHQNQPIRSPDAVRIKVGRLPKSSKPPIPQPIIGADNTAIPPVVAQLVAEELLNMENAGTVIPDELKKLINNPPGEPEKARSAEDVEVTDAEIDDYIRQAAAQQPLLQRATGIVRCPEILIPETGWFGIVFGSDWHIGSIWTQLLTILYEAQIINQTPGLYEFFGGDSVDGGIPAAPHGGILNEQIMPPYMQRAVSSRIMRLIAPKLIGAISGCHEWWAMDAADYDFIKEAAAEAGCVYLGGGNKFVIKTTGEAKWNGCYHHKAKGHSQYNVFHPNVRRALFHEQDSDIICVAHQHLAGTTRQVIGERLRYMARTGARKSFDKFASKIGADEGRDDLDVPVLLLHGTLGRQVKGQWIEGIPIAATVLTMLRHSDPYAKLVAN